MLTFFTTAKPFRGHCGIIQRNALTSWTLLHSGVEVILFGDDEGAAEVARELRIRHEPQTQKNEFGSNRVDDLFSQARELARHDALCYVNCDILLLPDFCSALEIAKSRLPRFLMVGRRWDTTVTEPIDFSARDWREALRRRALAAAARRDEWWIDYFAFPRRLFCRDFPPLAVGRPFWDNYTVWKALDSGAAVVDASATVLAVHQNHGYAHPQGHAGILQSEEARRNLELAGGCFHLRNIADAAILLTPEGMKPNPRRYWRSFHRGSAEIRNRAWFFFLDWTRPARRKLGLRAENLRRWCAKAPLPGKPP